MSDNLTTLISKVQAILGDNGTLFTTVTCTAAIRQALAEFNQVVPQILAITITGIDDQHKYDLSDQDPNAWKILDVLLHGENNNELDISLVYDDYIEGERLFFRLRSPVSSGDTLIVRYTKPHTISGLDSATESTILALHDQIIVVGAAFYSIIARATSRIETINLSRDQSDNYREIAGHFQAAFNRGLADAQRRRAPIGEPDSRAWNDPYHSWDQ